MAGKPQHALLRTALLQASIAGVAAVLVVAVWIAALAATDLDREQESRQAKAQAANLALNFEEQVHRQFLAVDQTLRILKLDWERDPLAFDLSALQRRAGSLSDVLSQVLILDARGRVVNGTRRDLIEADFSSRRYFQVHRRSDFDAAFADGPNRGSAGGAWYIALSRRLNAARGVFAGVVVAQYDLGLLTREFAQADLGPRGTVMLVGRDGIVRALVNRVPREPGADINGTDLFRAAFNGQNGAWTGPSPLDGVERVHAFRAVPGQDMVMIVGLDRQAALSNADARRQQAMIAAAAITVLLSLIAVGLGATLGTAQAREARLADDRAVLAAANQELKLARDRADAKSLELETTFAGMSDGISMVDEGLRLVSWNHRFPELAGLPPEKLHVGMPFEDVLRIQAEAGEFGPCDVGQEVAARMTALRAGAQAGGVIERQRPNGRTIELRRTVLPNGGFVTLFTDITARKQAEAAQRRARELAEQTAEEKSRFIAIVSHEIRTPLNVSLNALNLLDQSDLTKAQRRLVENGLQAGAALMGLLNDILDLSRMEVGRLVLRPAPFELRPVLESVVEMYRPIAAERGIPLRLAVGPGVPNRILTDAGRLRQVLMNLVSNAAKFAEPGAAQLRASVEMEAGRGAALRLAVQDSGPEIPDLDRARLFRPFSQLERQQRADGGGAGLGLAICQLLANLLGGQIGCDAVPTGGKEFWLTLPLDQIEARDNQAAPKPTAAPVPIFVPRTRVLLVEDIPANQLVVSTLLRREGHSVDIAGNGEEALGMVARGAYDLIFMDIFMPGMDGMETARHIRALPSPAGQTALVALTANVSPNNRADYIRGGFQDVLGKPVERTAMLAVLARHVWSGSSDAGRAAGRHTLAAPTPAAAATQALAVAGAAAPRSAAAAVPDYQLSPRAPRPLGASSPGYAAEHRQPPQQQALQQDRTTPTLDQARLAGVRGGLPPSIFASLIDGALDDLRERMPLLREALLDDMREEVVRVAHAMAGVAGSYGLAALEALLRRLMASGGPAALPEGRSGRAALAQEVEATLDRAERALKDLLAAEVA